MKLEAASAKEASGVPTVSGLKRSPKGKVKQKDLLIFFRQMAVILRSGVSLSVGLRLLSENMSSKVLAATIDEVADSLDSGEQLSECLKRYPKTFEPMTIGLIEAGEAAGVLAEVLERVATLKEEKEKINSQIKGALIYPVLVFGLAVTVSLALLIFIVPTFKEMFDSMDAELPWLTAQLLVLSQVVTSLWFAIIAPISVVAMSYVFKQYYATKVGRLTVDTLVFKIPLFGSLIIRSEMAAMCDTLGTLVKSGIPIVESLNRCKSATNNQLIRDSISRTIGTVLKGEEISYGMTRNSVFPRLVSSMVKIGEETGQLAYMLDNLSVFYKREVESTVGALTKAMEPMIIGVVAGIVGTIVVALYLPMFGLIQNMGK